MAGVVTEEMALKVPADKAWGVFGTLVFVEIVQKALPDQITNIVVLEGNGGQGTILQVFFTAGGWNREELVEVDNERLVKVAKLIEGGFLDMGFSSFQYRWEVIPKGADECIARGSMEYVARDEDAASQLSGDPLLAILRTAETYLTQNKIE